MFRRLRSTIIISCLAAATVLSGCSPQYYEQSADEAVYEIVRSRSDIVEEMPRGFRIEPETATGGDLVPSEPISLAQALEIATLNSREYQSRKEGVYLAALGLTGVRHDYVPNFFGVVGADYSGMDGGDTELLSGSARFGFSWLLNTGARLTTSLTTTLTHVLSGNQGDAAGSLFSVAVTQPLLRGFGYDTNEPLRQAERGMIYEMRNFVRFRRTFYVGIVSQYYRVLQQAQVLQNERMNRDNLRAARQRAELLLDAGRMPRLELDQTRQDELRAENRLQNAEQAYSAALDRFKVTLGLPTSAPLELDPGERDHLAEAYTALEGPEIESTRAAAVALRQRLDLATTEDRIYDAERQLIIACLNLRPGLNMTAGMSMGTEDNSTFDFAGGEVDYNVGMELDLPLDKLDERNAYRRSQIALDRARRAFEEARDSVVLEVRAALRQYYRSQRSYEILQESVRLARERVRSTSMLLEAGRASTRDMLEAREALLGAQNSLVQALVDYKLAGLQLARDTGVLEVGPMGTLEENFDEYY